jgi:hypothetical protein
MKKPDIKVGHFHGRRTDPLNEPVLQTLHSLLLNFGGIKERLEQLHLLVSEGGFSERAAKMQFLL